MSKFLKASTGLFLWASLCMSSASQIVLGASPGMLQVIDDTDAVVTLAKPATRIISIAPHATELVFAAGAGGRLVAVGEYSDYPAQAKSLPRIGDANRLDFEKIVSLKPDLIVAWASGNRTPDLERLEAFGFNVFKTEPQTFELIATNIERLGILTGQSDIADKAAAEFRTGTQALTQSRGDARKIKTFYQVWESPLMTLNGDHIISQVISACGGQNIFAELKPLVPQVDIEAVIQRDPAVIIAAGNAESDLDSLKSYWSRFPNLAANRDNTLFLVPTDVISRQSPRILEGARAICAALDTVRSY